MNILQFIAWLFTLVVIFVIVIGVVSIKYDYQKLTEENKKLKNDLLEARRKNLKKQKEDKKCK